MARLVIVSCTVGLCAALSSTAFAQDADAPPPAATGTTAPPAMATVTATAPSAGAGAPTVVVVEPPPDNRPKQGLEKAPANEPVMFRQGLFGVIGAVSDSPTVLAAATAADGLFIGVGAQFTWNDNGGTSAGLPGTANPPGGSHKFFSNLVLAGEYMIIDKLPFSLGPELTVVGSLAPDRVFTTLIFEPGVAFWYAPFRAPLVLGSAIDAEIFTQNGTGALKATVTVLTPGLRLGYIFN